MCSAFVGRSLLLLNLCVYVTVSDCVSEAVGMSGTVCLCLCLCVHIIVHVCWCVCVCVSLCPCVAVCLCLPWCCHLRQLQGQPGTAPAPPSLLSFIIICHKREPRRTVINKGHLKYETTTLTLGNISSVEQLVPPLSLWKGVPGAASPCPASSAPSPPSPPPIDSLPRPCPTSSGLEGLGRAVEGGTPRGQCRQGKSGPQFALLRCSVEDWVSWGKRRWARKGLRGDWQEEHPNLVGFPFQFPLLLSSGEGMAEGLQRAETHRETYMDTHNLVTQF